MSNESNTASSVYQSYDKKVDDLYKFRNEYYITHENSSSPDDRNRALNDRLVQLVAELEQLNESQLHSKASRLVLIGKAYNVLADFSQIAFDSLTKAIKLDPNSHEAWNYLGECYWKKRDFEMCKNCFERSMAICKQNKLSLRGLSMVMRQLINKQQLTGVNTSQESPISRYEQVKSLLDESGKYAKDSLQLDLKDGMSWYILANCYVAKFFSPFGQQNPSILKQAISAYNLALKDASVAGLQSDLYFNKSMISMYEENWPDVLYCLCTALNLDPHWSDVSENLKGTVNYLRQLNDLIDKKGKLKTKKYQSIVQSIKSSDLGPYLEGQLLTEDGKSAQKIELVQAQLKDLQKGLNKNKVLLGRVISGMPVNTADNLNIVCFTCCIVDSAGDCATLTIYNLAARNGLIIGDSVAIPDPWLEKVDLTSFNLSEHLKNKNLVRKLMAELAEGDSENCEGNDRVNQHLGFKFDSVRVENPAVLVINGKKWGKEKVSSAFFVPKVISD